jgi:uncharacterized protein (TIGR03067 family)
MLLNKLRKALGMMLTLVALVMGGTGLYCKLQAEGLEKQEVTPGAGAGAPKRNASMTDMASMQGVWVVVSAEAAGAAIPLLENQEYQLPLLESQEYQVPLIGSQTDEVALSPGARLDVCGVHKDGKAGEKADSSKTDLDCLRGGQSVASTEIGSTPSKIEEKSSKEADPPTWEDAPRQNGPPKSDKEKLQGKWKVVSAEANGREAPDAEKLKREWTFEGDKIIVKVGEEKRESTFKLDPGTKPKAIDIIPPEGSTENNGKPFKGIYALEDDRLKICFVPDMAERPSEFATKEGYRALLLMLERVKP